MVKFIIPLLIIVVTPVYIMLSEHAAPPRGLVALCEREPGYCQPAGPVREQDRLPASTDLFSLLNRVNREVNRSLTYRSDRETSGEADRWTRPGVGEAGDCEDYVLAKRDRLLRAGLPASALAIAIVHSRNTGFHAVLVVRTTRGDYVLDSAHSRLRRWDRTDYRWLSAQRNEHLLDWSMIGS